MSYHHDVPYDERMRLANERMRLANEREKIENEREKIENERTRIKMVKHMVAEAAERERKEAIKKKLEQEAELMGKLYGLVALSMINKGKQNSIPNSQMEQLSQDPNSGNILITSVESINPLRVLTTELEKLFFAGKLRYIKESREHFEER